MKIGIPFYRCIAKLTKEPLRSEWKEMEHATFHGRAFYGSAKMKYDEQLAKIRGATLQSLLKMRKRNCMDRYKTRNGFST